MRYSAFNWRNPVLNEPHAPSPARLTVIRHGETEWNVAGRYQGQSDSPLTANGRKQARALASVLSSDYDRLITSDSGRALETARILGAAVGLVPDENPSLRECRFGDFEGRTRGEIGRKWPGELARLKSSDPDFRPPGGETRRELYERTVNAFRELAAGSRGRRVLVVTHGMVLDSLVRHTLGLPLEAARFYSLPDVARNDFLWDGLFHLQVLGDRSHLEGLSLKDEHYDLENLKAAARTSGSATPA